jgi:hypothetical protein
MTEFIAWLASTRASALVQNVTWIIPAVQCLHILCVCVVMASMLLVTLRLAGLAGRSTPPAAYIARYRPFVWTALPVLWLTGAILIVGEPSRDLDNFTFWLKMALVVAATVLTATCFRRAGEERRPFLRMLALLSFFCWSGASICGRWIAYTYMN